MRWYLKESERKPNPAPVATDDRTPMLVGLGVWLLALGALLLIPGARAASPDFWLWACLVGISLGVIGLVYTHLRRR